MFEAVLAIAVLILGVVVAAGFLIITRLLRQLGGDTGTLRDSLIGRPGPAKAVPSIATGGAQEAAVAARTDAAAAKAEANAARGEARRILDAAREEANGILERAHRQADHDAEQIRGAARRSVEREIEYTHCRGQGAVRRRRAPPAAPR